MINVNGPEKNDNEIKFLFFLFFRRVAAQAVRERQPTSKVITSAQICGTK